MNIMYCGDSNVVDGLIISILSIVKHIKEELHIYVLTMNFDKYKALSSDNILELENEIKKLNKNSFIKIIDVEEYYNKIIPIANIGTRFTPYCMLRLYSDMLDIPDKILYLDCDVVCNNNFSNMYNMDISDYEIAGVLDNYGSHFFRKNIFKKDYINSGVLLLNMKLIRKNKLFERCRILCHDKKMFMPDQSALNKLAYKKLILPRKYNEQKEMHNDTVFRHYTTTLHFFPKFRTQTIKPWNIEEMHNVLNTYCFDDIIDKYIELKDRMNYE